MRRIRAGQIDLSRFDEDFMHRSEFYKEHMSLLHDAKEALDNSDPRSWTIEDDFTTPVDIIHLQPGRFYTLLYPVQTIAMERLRLPDIAKTTKGLVLEVTFGSGGHIDSYPTDQNEEHPSFLTPDPSRNSINTIVSYSGGGVYLFCFYPLAREWVFQVYNKISQ